MRIGFHEDVSREVHGDLEAQARAPPVARRAGRELGDLLGERAQQATCLRQSEEVGGLEHPALWMKPAGEGLDSDDARRAQVDLGEEVGVDLVSAECHSELVLKDETVEELWAEAGLEEAQGPGDRLDLLALRAVELAVRTRQDQISLETAVDWDHQAGLRARALRELAVDVDAEPGVDRLGGALERELDRGGVGVDARELAEEHGGSLPRSRVLGPADLRFGRVHRGLRSPYPTYV